MKRSTLPHVIAALTVILCMCTSSTKAAVKVGSSSGNQNMKPLSPFEDALFLEHVEYLAADELRGRNPGTEGSKKAAAYITERYRRFGFQPLGSDGTFAQTFPWRDEKGSNLVALLPGTGDLAEQAIIVSAHYDHLGADKKLQEEGEDGIYNGADDNASGVAALLLIAEALGAGTRASVLPRRSIVLIAFDCEERGLAGSRYYCQHPRWPLDRTVAAINLDMVGRLRSGLVYSSDITSSPLLLSKLDKLATSHGLSAQTQLTGIASDHRVFLNHKIPAFNLGTGTHSDRHRVSDEIEKINSAGGARVAWLAYCLLADLAANAQRIPFQQSDLRFDVNLILRITRGLGIELSLAPTLDGCIQVTSVSPRSAAAEAGVQSGDQIACLNGHTFERLEDILTLWSKLDLSEGLELSLLRGEAKLKATIPAELLDDLIERAYRGDNGSEPNTELHIPDKTKIITRTPSSLATFTVDGVCSYYVYSNADPGSKKGLPVIIFLGHPELKRENRQQFVGNFNEPVLLIWCDLFFGISGDTLVDDEVLWQKTRQEFVRLLRRYQERFDFDPSRVYLTGCGFHGAYAWMLAYDRPDVCTGVVAMLAVSYQKQLQRTLKSSRSVVTVWVVKGKEDRLLAQKLAQEAETGRIIESLNPHSKFILMPDEDHGSFTKVWMKYLDYIVQFKVEGTLDSASH